MKKILIVDDSPSNLATLENTLKDDYDTVAITSGLNALRFLETNKADLMLLDIEMPIMNGLQTLQKIREKAHLKDLKVILLTARKDEGTVVSGFKLGISDYITKPIDRDAVKLRIKKVLNSK